MQLEVNQAEGSKTIEVSESIFGVPYNNDLVHQVVNAYLAGSRAGTKAQKTRAEVRGGGAKPWRQKGTGRARAGTIRSPIWRSGGVTFAAKPRSFEQKVNKKVYRKAISCILSQLLKEGCLSIVDNIEVESNKTKGFINTLAQKNLPSEDLLIITDTVDEKLYYASRNLPTVDIIDNYEINPYILLRYSNVVVTESAVSGLEELFS